MNEQTKFIAFSTQKGGAGKTTMTVLIASYLHYVKGYDVAVIDCDYPQYSIVEMRRRDLKLATEDDYYRGMAYEQFTRLDKKAYPVVESNLKEAVADAEDLLKQRPYDYVFFDMPGTLNSPDLIHALARMDYIVAPISADQVVMESTLNYALAVKTHMVGKCSIKGLYLLWNMVDGREKTELYGVYEQVIAELELDILKTFVPNSLRFRREQSESHRAVFRSTLFPANKSLVRGSNLDASDRRTHRVIQVTDMGEKAKNGDWDTSFIIEDSRNIRDRSQRPPKPQEQLPEQPVSEATKDATPTSDKPEPKEPVRRKRGLPSYRDVFVVRHEIRRRQCVYISYEAHSLVASLVRVLVENGGEVTVGGYIDKIIHEHLQTYKDEINELYRNSRPDLLK